MLRRLTSWALCSILVLACAPALAAAAPPQGVSVIRTPPGLVHASEPGIASGRICWVERDDTTDSAQIWTHDIATAETLKLADTRVLGRAWLCTDGAHVAWIGLPAEAEAAAASLEVFTVPVTGGDVARVTDDDVVQSGLSVGEDTLAWAQTAAGEGPTTSIITATMAGELIAEADSMHAAGGTAIADGRVYYLASLEPGDRPQGEVRSAPLTGGEPQALGGLDLLGAVGPKSGGGRIAWAGWQANRWRAGVYSITPPSAEVDNVYRGPGDRALSLGTDGSRLGWLSYSSAGAPTLTFSDTERGLVYGFGVQDGMTFEDAVLNGPAIDDGRAVWVAADGSVCLSDLRQLPAALRQGGVNRVHTSAIASEGEFAEAKTVVIASAFSSADALSAAGLAGAMDGSLLLLGKQPAFEILDEVDRLEPSRVILIGEADVLSETAVVDIRRLMRERNWGPVERIGGHTRYDTARLVGDRILAEGGDATKAFIVRGDDFADGLAAAPAAYRLKARTILVAPNSVPAATAAAMATPPAEAVILGGEQAVTPAVESWFEDRGVAITRVAGSTRFATAANFAEYAIDRGWLSPARFGIANGLDFADALSGGVVVGHAGGPMLYVTPLQLSTATMGFLETHEQELYGARVFGGPKAVSDGVLSAIVASVPLEH